MQSGTSAITNLIGREPEVASLEELLADRAPLSAVVLSGVPGIGKSALLEAGVALARNRGFRVLTARPAESEAQLPFAGLADLLDGVGDESFALLPAPQRRALAVALLRAEPTGPPPPELAIATGLLGVLRALADEQRVLVAVDDAQWLDAASAAALGFAARRSAGDRVRLLLAVRAGSTSTLERALETASTRQLRPAPLDLDATRSLLSRRDGLILPAAQLRHIFEVAQGNPLVALELSRVLRERGRLASVLELPPDQLAIDLFRDRAAALDATVRDVLLALALSPQLSAGELESICDTAAVERALAAGAVVADRHQLRPAQPLLAAAVLAQSPASAQQALHLALSETVADELRAAYHLAMATVGKDAERADSLAAAASLAARRGAAADAATLARHALELTPRGSEKTTDRLLELAGYLFHAAQFDELTELLSPRLAKLPAGPQRARAHLLLAEAAADIEDHHRQLERALAEGAAQPELTAVALALQAQLFAVIRVDRLTEARQCVKAGLALSPISASARHRLEAAGAWVDLVMGVRIEEPGSDSDDEASLYETAIERPAAVQLACRGEIAPARERFTALLAIAEERGEAVSRAVLHHNLLELAVREGDVTHVRELLETWDSWGVEEQLIARQRCEALLAAIAGERDAAVAAARAVLERDELRRWDRLEAHRALGIAALFDHDPGGAVTELAPVWEHTLREHVDELGAFPVAADLVEALVELDRVAEAREVATRLRTLAERQEHPWGLASAERCEALVTLSDGYQQQAIEALRSAAQAYGELGLRFDRARTLLSLGHVERRHKKWGAARSALEQALAAFAELHADGWAEQARSELTRVGARRPGGAGQLTAAEQRVVALALDGLSNKEIARDLVVSVHTVEVHLSHAYAKLGIRSRSQLARALASSA